MSVTSLAICSYRKHLLKGFRILKLKAVRENHTIKANQILIYFQHIMNCVRNVCALNGYRANPGPLSTWRESCFFYIVMSSYFAHLQQTLKIYLY